MLHTIMHHHLYVFPRLFAIILALFVLTPVTSIQAQATSVAFSNDPATPHYGIWGPSTVVAHNGLVGDWLSLYRNGVLINSAEVLGAPNAQMGGWNIDFLASANGDVMSVEPGGASCTIRIVNVGGTNYVYCNVAMPDDDADGVHNSVDLCPGTPPPTPVDANGCYIPEPEDTDGDGIPDAIDNCPFVANPDQADDDGDTVGNLCDSCPNIWGPADNYGCPYDGTHTPTPTLATATPIITQEPLITWTPSPLPDRDGDGILNQDDRCPDAHANGSAFQPGSEYYGCPDRDFDELPDHVDQCPDKGKTTDRGGEGFGVYANGCPIPDPLGRIGTDDVCTLGTNANLQADHVNIREEPGSDNIPGKLHILTTTNKIHNVENVDGTDWYEIEVDGVRGWVSGDVTRTRGDCSALGNSLLSSAYIDANCPDYSEAFLHQRSYMRWAINTSEDICQAARTYDQTVVALQASVTDRMPAINQLRQCPQYLPVLMEFIINIEDFSIDLTELTGQTDITDIWEYINQKLEEDACAFAENINTGRLWADFPPEIADDLLIPFCNSNITTQRYDEIRAQLAELGITIDTSQSLQSNCNLIQQVNIIGYMTDGQLSAYNSLLQCGKTNEFALDVILTAIVTQANLSGVDWSTVACENLENAIVGRPAIELPLPEQLQTCPAYITNLFLFNHKPVLEERTDLEAANAYQRILMSDDPCFAMMIYILTGELPKLNLPTTPTPTPPEPVSGNTNTTYAAPVYYTIPPAPFRPVFTVLDAQTQRSGVDTGSPNSDSIPDQVNDMFELYRFGDVGLATFIGNPSDMQTYYIYIQESVTLGETTAPPRIEGRENPISTADINTRRANLLVYIVDRGSNRAEIVLLLWAPRGTPISYDGTPDYTVVFDSRVIITPDFTIIASLADAVGNEGIYEISIRESSGEVIFGTPQLVVENGVNPAISTELNLIAFERTINGRTEVFVSTMPKTDESPEERISPPNLNCYSPTFGNQGKDIFFLCDTPGNGQTFHQVGISSEDNKPITGEGVNRLANLEYVNGIISVDDGEIIYYGLDDGSAEVSVEPVVRIRDETVYRLRWNIGR